jgi:hypothetical protein
MFHGNYGHAVDLSAFLALSPSVHVPPEDPPPYSEQLLEGHVTLMHGGTMDTNKDDSINDDPNTTLLTVGDVSMLNNSAQDNFFNSDYQNELSVSMNSSAGGVDGSVDNQHSCPFVRLPALNGANDTPTQIMLPPVIRRPHRSISLDNSDPFLRDIDREQPAADSMRPFHFPPRLSPVQPMSFLGDEGALNQTFPARPLRLPPLLGTSAPSQHRKRSKRRRGHSWHGEATGAITPAAMTTVAE